MKAEITITLPEGTALSIEQKIRKIIIKDVRCKTRIEGADEKIVWLLEGSKASITKCCQRLGMFDAMASKIFDNRATRLYLKKFATKDQIITIETWLKESKIDIKTDEK